MSHPWIHRGIALVLASLLAACSITIGPTAVPTGIVHIENRMANAVIVGTGLLSEIAPPDQPTATKDPATDVVASCGGRLDVATPIAFADHPSGALIGLAIDPTGELDRDLANVGGDVSKLTGDYQQMSIIWSRGAMATPLWVTIGPDAVLTSTSAPAAASSGPCLPWSEKG